MKMTDAQQKALTWLRQYKEWVTFKKIEAYEINISAVIALEKKGLVEMRKINGDWYERKEWRAVQ